MQALQKNARLYMVPGMAHCSGGPGPNNFGQLFSSVVLDAPVNHDILASLEAWVEAGRAPAAIIATKSEHDDPHDRVMRTMPLCPYPGMAQYSAPAMSTRRPTGSVARMMRGSSAQDPSESLPEYSRRSGDDGSIQCPLTAISNRPAG